MQDSKSIRYLHSYYVGACLTKPINMSAECLPRHRAPQWSLSRSWICVCGLNTGTGVQWRGTRFLRVLEWIGCFRGQSSPKTQRFGILCKFRVDWHWESTVARLFFRRCQYYWVLVGTTECFSLPLGVSRCHRVLVSTTGWHYLRACPLWRSIWSTRLVYAVIWARWFAKSAYRFYVSRCVMHTWWK